MGTRVAPQSRRRYSAEDRAKVLADIDALGVRGAAKRHGVHESCVVRWRKASATPGRAVRGAVKSTTRTAGTNAAPKRAMQRPKEARASAAVESRRTPSSERGRRRKVQKSYTPSEKAQAIELMSEVGPTEASRRLGVDR